MRARWRASCAGPRRLAARVGPAVQTAARRVPNSPSARRHSSRARAAAAPSARRSPRPARALSPASAARFPASSSMQRTRVPVKAEETGAGARAAHASARPRARGSPGQRLRQQRPALPPRRDAGPRRVPRAEGGRQEQRRVAPPEGQRLQRQRRDELAGQGDAPDRPARRGRTERQDLPFPKEPARATAAAVRSCPPPAGRRGRGCGRRRGAATRAWRRSSRSSSILPKNRSGSSAAGGAPARLNHAERPRHRRPRRRHERLVDEFPARLRSMVRSRRVPDAAGAGCRAGCSPRSVRVRAGPPVRGRSCRCAWRRAGAASRAGAGVIVPRQSQDPSGPTRSAGSRFRSRATWMFSRCDSPSPLSRRYRSPYSPAISRVTSLARHSSAQEKSMTPTPEKSRVTTLPARRPRARGRMAERTVARFPASPGAPRPPLRAPDRLP